MTLQRVQARGDAAGRRAAIKAATRIVDRAHLPPDVTIEQSGSGIIIAAKHLRRRLITEPELRNFAHE